MIIYPFPTLTVGLATRRDEVIEDMILDVKDSKSIAFVTKKNRKKISRRLYYSKTCQ